MSIHNDTPFHLGLLHTVSFSSVRSFIQNVKSMNVIFGGVRRLPPANAYSTVRTYLFHVRLYEIPYLRLRTLPASRSREKILRTIAYTLDRTFIDRNNVCVARRFVFEFFFRRNQSSKVVAPNRRLNETVNVWEYITEDSDGMLKLENILEIRVK